MTNRRVISTIMGLSPSDPRYEHCQALGSTIEVLLYASKDPLRQAIVTVLDYDDADIEEYAYHLAKMVQLLPPEQIP